MIFSGYETVAKAPPPPAAQIIKARTAEGGGSTKTSVFET